MTEDLIARLRKRAEICRKIPRGEPDRISDILEEAAGEIESLRRTLGQREKLTTRLAGREKPIDFADAGAPYYAND